MLEATHKDDEFADEATRTRQANTGHHHKHEHDGVLWHLFNDTAKTRNHPRVHLIVDDTNDQEQRTADHTMAQHLVNRAINPLAVHGEQAQGYIAHVRDRAVGDNLFHVVLHQRHERGVDDCNNRQHKHKASKGCARLRQQGQAEAQEAVATHFQQNAS